MSKYKAEKVLPYNNEEAKNVQISRMFDSIAHSYDELNIALSMGIDRIWSRRAMKALKKFSPQPVIDVAI